MLGWRIEGMMMMMMLDGLEDRRLMMGCMRDTGRSLTGRGDGMVDDSSVSSGASRMRTGTTDTTTTRWE